MPEFFLVHVDPIDDSSSVNALLYRRCRCLPHHRLQAGIHLLLWLVYRRGIRLPLLIDPINVLLHVSSQRQIVVVHRRAPSSSRHRRSNQRVLLSFVVVPVTDSPVVPATAFGASIQSMFFLYRSNRHSSSSRASFQAQAPSLILSMVLRLIVTRLRSDTWILLLRIDPAASSTRSIHRHEADPSFKPFGTQPIFRRSLVASNPSFSSNDPSFVNRSPSIFHRHTRRSVVALCHPVPLSFVRHCRFFLRG